MQYRVRVFPLHEGTLCVGFVPTTRRLFFRFYRSSTLQYATLNVHVLGWRLWLLYGWGWRWLFKADS